MPKKTDAKPKAKPAAAKPGRRAKVAPVQSTSAREDYLECILNLIRRKGLARAVDIAEALEIAQPSVTAMTQRLAAEGLLTYEKYRGITFTPEGERLAKAILTRHEILTRFLRHFGLDELTIYRDVEGMEHHISRDTLRAFEVLTAELERNPELAGRLRKAM